MWKRLREKKYHCLCTWLESVCRIDVLFLSRRRLCGFSVRAKREGEGRHSSVLK